MGKAFTSYMENVVCHRHASVIQSAKSVCNFCTSCFLFVCLFVGAFRIEILAASVASAECWIQPGPSLG